MLAYLKLCCVRLYKRGNHIPGSRLPLRGLGSVSLAARFPLAPLAPPSPRAAFSPETHYRPRRASNAATLESRDATCRAEGNHVETSVGDTSPNFRLR